VTDGSKVQNIAVWIEAWGKFTPLFWKKVVVIHLI